MRSISFFLLLTLSLVCTCHAYQFALISKTIPKGSYYVVTSLTSKYLAPFAGNQRTQSFNSSISTTPTTDAYVDTRGTGYFAIVSMEKDILGSYCVIRVLDAESSTIQQNGLACTIAPSLALARVQVEPSLVTCGGSNAISVPCKSSIVAVLDIDAETQGETTAAATEETSGASLGAIIGAVSAGIVGIFIIAGLLMYRAARNRAAYKRNTTAVIYNNNPQVTVSPISTPLGGVHVRSQTEQLMSTYMVNPVLNADQPDISQPAPDQYQAGNIYKPRLNLANAAR